MRHAAELRETIIRIGKWLYERGMIVAGDGNISARLPDGSILCTPAGLCKGIMEAGQLLVVDRAGATIFGDLKPSSELPMHLEVYARRPDVNAVVHAHPPVSTGFACAGVPLDRAILSEVILTLGTVPVAPYGTPSTAQVPEGIRELILDHDGLLLANHGVMTVGPDLMTAFQRMEIIEHTARITLVTHALGKQKLLSSAQVAELKAVIEKSGGSVRALSAGKKPICAEDVASGTDHDVEADALLSRLADLIGG